ncbi:protein of unknown function [bacterium A37T11]|nr:protein of unknown function [bacterium A37T11]
MKNTLFYLLIMASIALGCSHQDLQLYDDIARVQLNDTAMQNYTFIYEPAAVIRDTFYLQINTIGGFTNEDRPVSLIQIPEYDQTIVRDPVTNAITDTVQTDKPFKAIPGTHYIDLEDPSVKSLMVVKAGAVSAKLPIILLRDPSLKENSYRLRLQLQSNDQFGLGEKKMRAMTIIFSDHLERFYSWRVDGTQATAYNAFGKYSVGKHQFMIDILHTPIDEEWYQAIVSSGALQNYINVLKQALIDFNGNPSNIASGKAPVRETSDPNSPSIFFR